MIDIFKDTLQEGMEITACKEYASKYKVTLSYKGMTGNCELGKTCAPKQEKSFCRKAIDTIVSGMYINAGNLEEAKAWLEGERWNIEETKTISASEETKEVLENILERIDKEVWESLDDGGDDWFTADKVSQIKEIIESYMK
jgi:hypothetical protein